MKPLCALFLGLLLSGLGGCLENPGPDSHLSGNDTNTTWPNLTAEARFDSTTVRFHVTRSAIPRMWNLKAENLTPRRTLDASILFQFSGPDNFSIDDEAGGPSFYVNAIHEEAIHFAGLPGGAAITLKRVMLFSDLGPQDLRFRVIRLGENQGTGQGPSPAAGFYLGDFILERDTVTYSLGKAKGIIDPTGKLAFHLESLAPGISQYVIRGAYKSKTSEDLDHLNPSPYKEIPLQAWRRVKDTLTLRFPLSGRDTARMRAQRITPQLPPGDTLESVL